MSEKLYLKINKLSSRYIFILPFTQGFRPLRRTTKGAAFGNRKPFEKGLRENFTVPRKAVKIPIIAAPHRP